MQCRTSNFYLGAIALLIGVWLASAPAQAQSADFKADLKGASEVPPTTSAGTGTVTVNLEEESRIITFNVAYSGLTGPATAAHFHGPAGPGENAGVAVPILASKLASTTFNAAATLSEQQVKDLEEGRMYFNIHTAANPGGEIRGQVVRVK